MTTSAYYKDEIHCECGQCFRVGLEDSISDRLWEDRFDSELEDTARYVCPNCKRTYELTIKMELTVERSYANLEEVEEHIQGAPISILQGRWIGDKIVLEEGDGFTPEVLMPDGVYVTGDTEYHVVNGIVTEFWGRSDEHQLTLFEENAA